MYLLDGYSRFSLCEGLLEDLRSLNKDRRQLMGGRKLKVSVHCLVNNGYMVSPGLPVEAPGHTSLGL